MLVVQTASIVEGANSYVSLSDAQQYLDRRELTTKITEGILLRAADYINSFREVFKGRKTTPATSDMQWPRNFVVMDGFYLDGTAIPQLIIDAQIEAAIEIASGRDPQSTVSSQTIRRKRIDTLEIEYETTEGRATLPTFQYRKVMSLLQPVLKTDLFRVSR